MKKIITAAVAFAVAALAVSQMVSCEKYILPELTVTPDTLKFSAGADSTTVKLHSNVVWNAKGNPEWVELSLTWGEEDAEILVTVGENTSSQSRQASVSVKSETIQRYLVVEQDGVTAD